MELRHLRYFVGVGEEQHYGRAAKRLGVAQPALSRQIQDLERELGFALFDRLPRGVKLSAAGKLFLDDARQILQHVDEAKLRAERVASGKAGTLRMGVTPQTLQWLPGSRERVFTVAQNGYVWTDVKIGGSILTPQEDLSARLANALRDEAVHQGRRFIEDLPSAAKDGAKGVLDTLTPLIK